MEHNAYLSPLTRRGLTLWPLAALLLVLALLNGCGVAGSEPNATLAPTVQPTPSGAQASAQLPTSESTPAAQVVIPGMPSGLCVAAAAPSPTSAAASPGQPAATQPPAVSVAPWVFYCGGQPAEGWSDASWGGAKTDYSNSDFPREGKPTIKASLGNGWGAFSMADWNKSNLPDTGKYSHLHFWVNGGQAGGQIVGAMLYTNGGEGERVHVEKYIQGGRIPANKWQEVFIPLDDLKASGQTAERVVFQEITGKAQPPVYFDGIELYSDNRPTPTPVTLQAAVTIDLGKNRKPISPYIYGTSLAPADVVKDANITVNRLGGNPYSRYNWTLGNARNAGSDWEYRNYSREEGPQYKAPSGLADTFYRANKSAGADTLLTVPLIGYVARNDDSNTRSEDVPEEGGAPVSPGSQAIRGYDPTRNRQATSVKSQARKGAPFADPPSTTGPVYQDEWIDHLTKTFGPSAQGGVRFYAMDNEPDLWADNTHVDVHPVRPGYDDMFNNFLEYARAVKAVDATAQVTGPVVSGWTGYWFSALDRGTDSFRSHPDRSAHGNMPFLPWFLDQARKADQAAGSRTLDVLDIHYYPQAQGLMEDKVDRATGALRLRSTRALWDPSYEDESWIARTEDPHVMLIPRMLGWIGQYYPGTKLGITEWKWGAENTMNGALAIADVLGIYGREGVYLANYFTYPPLGSPGLAAFKMYRNYDGHNSTFGDTSVSATSSNPDTLSVFASEDTHTNQVKVMVLNKSEREQQAITLNLQGGSVSGSARVYSFSNATGITIKQLPDAPLSGPTLLYTVAPYSINLLVIDKAK